MFGLPRLEHNFDYRGVEVVADQRPIGGTDWHLVAKIDAAEIHSTGPAVALALAVTLALILAVGTGALVFSRQRLRLFAAERHAGEVEREALAKHLDLMSRYANDSILLYDEAGRILEANERAVEHYGYPRDELIGMPTSQLSAPSAAIEAHADAKQAESAGSGVYETLHRRKDGSEFPVETSFRVIELDDRRLTQAIIRDISERKRAEAARRESEERYRLIAETSSDVITVIDAESRITFTSPATDNVFGYHAEEMIGQPLTLLMAEDLRASHLAGLKRYMETGQRSRNWKSTEFRGRHKSGSEFPVEISFGEFVQNGKRAFAGIIRDISERKRSEAALRESATRLRRLFDSDLIGILFADRDKIFDANDAFLGIVGYTREDLEAGTIRWRQMTPPEWAAADDKGLEELSSRGSCTPFEKEYFRKDGSRVAILIGTAIVEKEPVSWVCFVQDITGRKRAEARIARLSGLKDMLSAINSAIVHVESEQALFDEVCAIAVRGAVFDYAGMGMADPESGEVRWLAHAGDAAGDEILAAAPRSASADRPEGRSPSGTAMRERRHVVIQDFHNDPRTAHWKERARRLDIGSSAVFPITRAGAVVGTLNVYSKVVNAFDAEAVALLDEIAQDVSFALDNLDRERARRIAEDRAGELMSIVNRSPAVFFEWNAGGERPVKFVSDNMAELGYPAEDFVSGKLKYTGIIHPEDLAGFIEERQRAEREGRTMAVREYRVVAPDGQIRVVEDRTWWQRETNGGIRRYQGVILDISARKRAEVELRAVEQQFRGLVEQSIAGIYIVADGRVAYVNPRCAEIFGYTPEEVIGTEFLAYAMNDDRPAIGQLVGDLVSGRIKKVQYNFGGRRKDGTRVEIGAHATYSAYHGKPAVIGILQDITERKRTEDEVQRHLAELQQAMMATVRVASIMGEMRDPYTSGHERRVGELSAAIGAELGLTEHQIEGLRVAGYLHDIGKIIVPSEILSKPGKISRAEFDLIKDHAQQGYEILKEVNFPWPVALVARQHHERLGGTGYPQGLKGDEIILEARILAVADIVEAMASHRPYRPGLGIEAALAEIERGSGEHYDQLAVDACLRLFREKGYQLPA